MNKTFILLLVFVFTIVPIVVLSYNQGAWDGMRSICPEPSMIVESRLGEKLCYSPERWAELTTEEMENFNLEDYMEVNYGSKA